MPPKGKFSTKLSPFRTEVGEIPAHPIDTRSDSVTDQGRLLLLRQRVYENFMAAAKYSGGKISGKISCNDGQRSRSPNFRSSILR